MLEMTTRDVINPSDIFTLRNYHIYSLKELVFFLVIKLFQICALKTIAKK